MSAAVINQLEEQLKKLRIEFERYFNGALDLPPVDLQQGIERRLRDLRGNVKGSADLFRLQALEARFNSYNEMFNRRLRDAEEGRSPRRRHGAAPQYDPMSGIVVGDRIDSSAAAALYQSLYASASSSKHVDVDRFRGYLERQATMIRQKTGCSQVKFRLAEEGGKLKLKAKPLKDS